MILAGRGDNTAGVYQFDKTSATVINCLQTQNFLNTTQKGFAMAPKHCVDVGKQEVMRSVRITNTGKLDVLAMRIPSKVGGFNQEYYPPFSANEPSSTAEDWCAGQDVLPKTMQLSATSKVNKKKKSGLNRLKGGPKASAAAEATASTGAASSEAADALRA